MIKYALNNSGVFYVTFTGNVSALDIVNYLQEFETLTGLPNRLLTFYNLENAILKLKPSEIILVAKLAKKVTSKYQSVYTAFFVDEPTSTAYSLIFITAVFNIRNTRKVFSTHEAAMQWLLER